MIKFHYGIVYKDVLYGWKDKELYRLPQMIGKRFYPLRKVGKWANKGYYFGKERKSFSQLESMTTFIDKKVESVSHEDCPF
jgi:hypothetical protein